MMYKILKRKGTYTNGDWYYVYRRKWLFWWERIGNLEPNLEGAEEIINSDKRERKKPELVGYYS